ncbi:MAG: multicopper oxidase domain-containing protein [Candidatus Eremiobacteraeota bacterium]|nr:multicopper oxidase domain-containing protein [Candidatus Eremiobacteraeota bacterium]
MRVLATFALAVCTVAMLAMPALARERTLFIAADDIVWYYAPSGRDLIAGASLPVLQPAQLGWAYQKLVYREYTDATFKKLKTRPPSERYLGLVGPVIRAQVGDVITIHFRNNTRTPVDMAVDGVPLTFPAQPVAPGTTHIYRWPINEASGPGPNDPSSIVSLYYSDLSQGAEVEAGLFGPIVISRRGALRPNDTPGDVDRELIVVFDEIEEKYSQLFPRNLADPAVNPRRVSGMARLLNASNTFNTINGFIFGNMPMPEIHVGERVRWYLLTPPSGKNMTDFNDHTVVWSGQTVIVDGRRADAVPIGTASHRIADMIPDATGIWLLSSALDLDALQGMIERYRVSP